MPGEGDAGRAPVGPAAVSVGELVLTRQLPRAEEVTGLPEDLWVLRERGHCPADEERRLGCEEVLVLLSAVPPVLLGDPVMLQNGFRSQVPRRNGDCGYTVGMKLHGHAEREALERELDGLREGVATGDQHVVLSHFDDEPLDRKSTR